MGPPNDADDSDSKESSFVYCSDCGAKASRNWTYCRNCEGSLDDPVEGSFLSADGERVEITELSGDSEGCPKCGHTDAEVDDIATTGTGFSRLFDVQNRRFRAVSCTRCGYTEFYRGRTPDEVVDLFIG
jgi:predicted nucleic-acid-binding Zn-ribbon protein